MLYCLSKIETPPHPSIGVVTIAFVSINITDPTCVPGSLLYSLFPQEMYSNKVK